MTESARVSESMRAIIIWMLSAGVSRRSVWAVTGSPVTIMLRMTNARNSDMSFSCFKAFYLLFHTIQSAHDTLQFLFVVEGDADFAFTLGRTGHLHLGLEEMGQTLLQDVKLLGHL